MSELLARVAVDERVDLLEAHALLLKRLSPTRLRCVHAHYVYHVSIDQAEQVEFLLIFDRIDDVAHPPRFERFGAVFLSIFLPIEGDFADRELGQHACAVLFPEFVALIDQVFDTLVFVPGRG